MNSDRLYNVIAPQKQSSKARYENFTELKLRNLDERKIALKIQSSIENMNVNRLNDNKLSKKKHNFKAILNLTELNSLQTTTYSGALTIARETNDAQTNRTVQ